jgi:hypothetical protein
MAKWFYAIEDQPAGPIDPAALKQLATTGRLKPTDKVRREDMADWYEATQVKGLFDTAEQQARVSQALQIVTASENPQAPSATSDSETARKRGNAKSNRAALYGCGCLVTPFALALIVSAVGAIRGTIDPEYRARVKAQTPVKYEAVGSGPLRAIDETPPPVTEAINAGREVWLLRDFEDYEEPEQFLTKLRHKGPNGDALPLYSEALLSYFPPDKAWKFALGQLTPKRLYLIVNKYGAEKIVEVRGTPQIQYCELTPTLSERTVYAFTCALQRDGNVGTLKIESKTSQEAVYRNAVLAVRRGDVSLLMKFDLLDLVLVDVRRWRNETFHIDVSTGNWKRTTTRGYSDDEGPSDTHFRTDNGVAQVLGMPH